VKRRGEASEAVYTIGDVGACTPRHKGAVGASLERWPMNTDRVLLAVFFTDGG